MNERVAHWMSRGIGELRELGPYLAAELLLPGGSLLAAISVIATLWRRHHPAEARS
jgi:hypothetical protein